MSKLKKYLRDPMVLVALVVLAVALLAPEHLTAAGIVGIGITETQFAALRSQEYKTAIEMLAQQTEAITDGTHRIESVSGKRVFFPQVGSVRMQKKEGRADPVPMVNTPFSERAVTSVDEHIRDFVDSFDKLKTATDPGSAIGEAQLAAARRSKDKIMIDRALGTAYTGEDGTTQVALPTLQKGAVGSTGFTLAKLKAAVKRLRQRNATKKKSSDPIHCFWTSDQESGFIDTTEVKSVDFNRDKVMVDGELTYYYGVYFARIEDFVDDNNVVYRLLPYSGTTRSTVLWVKSGIAGGYWMNPAPKVDWIPERQSFQVYLGQSFGASRMQEVKVYQLDAKET